MTASASRRASASSTNLDTALAGKLDGFAPITVAGSKVDGKLMMVPESAKTLGMFYNTSLVKTAAGIAR